MSEFPRRVADDLDPVRYVEHVTRTAVLLEKLSEDMRAAKERAAAQERTLETIRADLSRLAQDFAVFKAETASKLSLRGTIVAGIVGVLGAVAALVWYVVMK